MATLLYITRAAVLLFLALWANSVHAHMKASERSAQSNASFYGGVALWQTITGSAQVCPSGVQTCSQGGGTTCCPQGTYCEHNGYYCCPIDVDCSAAVNVAPACADPSWGLYEAAGNQDIILFCCLPDTHGLPGTGCVPSGYPATQQATSVTQAHFTAGGSSPATIGSASPSQSAVAGNGTGAGGGSGTPTTQASSTSTQAKSGANKFLAGGCVALLTFVFALGLVTQNLVS